MAKITIQRTNEYTNRMRDYHIYINDKKVGTIENGGTKDFEIEEGRHTIEARIDWCASPKVNVIIKNGETKTFKVGGFKYGNWLMPVSLILIFLSFVLEHFFNFNYLGFAEKLKQHLID
ncbi:MAG: hypothetical protein CFE24_08585 [Flavobacterium sp. BFFFF2]|nr:MAG: hypothetical protein CFE24_08585 [Flavobacterium sp. BFFFF2]